MCRSVQPASAYIRDFFTLMAVCHTVVPETDEDYRTIRYQAASPGEGESRRPPHLFNARRVADSWQFGVTHSRAERASRECCRLWRGIYSELPSATTFAPSGRKMGTQSSFVPRRHEATHNMFFVATASARVVG